MQPFECVCEWIVSAVTQPSTEALIAQLEAHSFCTEQQCYESADDAFPMVGTGQASSAVPSAIAAVLFASILWRMATRSQSGTLEKAPRGHDEDRGDGNDESGVTGH